MDIFEEKLFEKIRIESEVSLLGKKIDSKIKEAYSWKKNNKNFLTFEGEVIQYLDYLENLLKLNPRPSIFDNNENLKLFIKIRGCYCGLGLNRNDYSDEWDSSLNDLTGKINSLRKNKNSYNRFNL